MSMHKNIDSWAKSMFDSIKHIDEETQEEYWLGRELAEVMGYSWVGFGKVIDRSRMSLSQTGQAVDNHFQHVLRMVPIGSGAERPSGDIKMTRYACYIVAQNGNAAKVPAVAAAQAYFAFQTRKQELNDQIAQDTQRLMARHRYSESDKKVTSSMIEKGIGSKGIGDIKSSGDKMMFGGKTTRQMKKQYGVTNSTPLADRTPNVVLAAKALANEMTAQNLADYPIDGYDNIKGENDDNNLEVRKTLLVRGIVPEHLPPAEDTEHIRSRLKKNEQGKGLSS